ncbi:MAG: hypothetical protein HY905_12940 [Deltaproteobacteria bacterium]|nr:hypothetical protein [Deltaproteobacteria bacterium]
MDDRSLIGTDDLLSARAWFGNGTLLDTVEEGRIDLGNFAASGADVALQLVLRGSDMTLAIHDARVVWDLEQAPSGHPPLDGKLVRGLLGGFVFLADAVEFLRPLVGDALVWFYPNTDPDETVRTILAGQADLDVIPEGFTDGSCTERTAFQDCAPGQSCRQDPDRDDAFFCYEYDENPDAISVAFVFTAVSCNIVGIYHEGP